VQQRGGMTLGALLPPVAMWLFIGLMVIVGSRVSPRLRVISVITTGCCIAIILTAAFEHLAR
jgi:hypothetical protein